MTTVLRDANKIYVSKYIDRETIFLRWKDIVHLLNVQVFVEPSSNIQERMNSYLYMFTHFYHILARLDEHEEFFKFDFSRCIEAIVMLIHFIQYVTKELYRFHDQSLIYQRSFLDLVILDEYYVRDFYSFFTLSTPMTAVREKIHRLVDFTMYILKQTTTNNLRHHANHVLDEFETELFFITHDTPTMMRLSKQKVDRFRKELMQKACHPSRFIQCVDSVDLQLLMK